MNSEDVGWGSRWLTFRRSAGDAADPSPRAAVRAVDAARGLSPTWPGTGLRITPSDPVPSTGRLTLSGSPPIKRVGGTRARGPTQDAGARPWERSTTGGEPKRRLAASLRRAHSRSIGGSGTCTSHRRSPTARWPGSERRCQEDIAWRRASVSPTAPAGSGARGQAPGTWPSNKAADDSPFSPRSVTSRSGAAACAHGGRSESECANRRC
jgi:hypothetical protein